MTELSDAYWAGAADGRLVLQTCTECGRVRHYPQMMCPACFSFGIKHITATGHGTVHSWTISHHAFLPSLRDQVPYTLVTVDMDEDVRVLGRLSGRVAPSIGMSVHVSFEMGADDKPIPVFTQAT